MRCLQSVSIFSILNQPCSFMVYIYFFGVFLFFRLKSTNFRNFARGQNNHSKYCDVRFGSALTWTLVFSLRKNSSPQPEIRRFMPVEIRFNFRSVLLDLRPFTEKHVFECQFVHAMILFLSYLV